MPQADGATVLVGSLKDDHVRAMHDRLESIGARTLVLDAQRFPDASTISLGAEMANMWADGHKLGRPSSVYVRSLYGDADGFVVDTEEAMRDDWRRTLAIFRERYEILSAIVNRWGLMGVPLYNPIGSERQTSKPVQLAILQAAGLPVPDTLWTNDAEAVRRFAEGRRVAYKPVCGGAVTRELTREDLSDRRLKTLATAPVTFQELLPGEDVRVYVIDGEVVASLRVVTTALDFRGQENRVEVMELDPEIRDGCVEATKLLGLRFTGIDLKRDGRGQLRFLELNSSPMYIGFDQRAGTDILGRLAETLARLS